MNGAMTAADILAAFPAGVPGLVTDSRRVQTGALFAAMPGCTGGHDGRDHVAEAMARGAAGILWADDDGRPAPGNLPVPVLAVAGLRGRLGEIAGELHGHPSRSLPLIGITGTNGKTTVCQWIARGLTAIGQPCGFIGTLGHGMPGGEDEEGESPRNTTPDAAENQQLLAEMRRRGAVAAAMEVSSIALEQSRVAGLHFHSVLFTNLGRDHLDYHGDPRVYAEAKAKLFTGTDATWAVINLDDAFGRELCARLRGGAVRVLGYGLEDHDAPCVARIRGQVTGQGLDHLELAVSGNWGQGRLRAPVSGGFNAANLMAALGAWLSLGIGFDDALTAAAAVRPVPGRMEALPTVPGRPRVVVDYAHTPEALARTLEALRPWCQGRLTCVFGAGGCRDRGKRPLMGDVAGRLADSVVLTSDNPRSEDPEEIIDDIASGLRSASFIRVADRRLAIGLAIARADAQDLVLIAGKGHEDGQEIDGVTHPFSDREVATAMLEGASPCSV